MEKIHGFINEFLEFELEANLKRFNEVISDDECLKHKRGLTAYSHSILGDLNIGRSKGELDKYQYKQLIKVNLENVLKRSLFQIKKYENPTCGDVIKRILKENIIYLCYTSRDEQIDDNPLGYNNVYVVAETNEGLKIIDIILYHKGQVFITNDKDTSDVEHFGIKEYGKLMEVKKYQAPEEESSLKDYNSDN